MKANIKQEHLEKWADYLINHSLGGVNKNDIVMLKGEAICWPLLSVLQDKIFAAGAIADMNITAPDNNRGAVWGASVARHGSEEQIAKVPQWHIDRYRRMTKFIEVLGAENPEFFGNVDEKLAQAVAKADELPKNVRLSKNWVITLFPTQGFADMEEMSLEEYTDVIVNASIVDPKILDEVEEDLARLIKEASKVKIETEHPDTGKLLTLEMDITDRLPVKCVGTRNFPDGEVYTSPDANTVTGEIFVDLPVFQGGATIQGIYLKFEEGKIVDYSAKTGGEALQKIIETDAGSHRLGEVALGMNNGIEKVLKHPLFVEKVGGTMHIAIGNSYPASYVEDPSSDEGKAKIEEYTEKGIYNKSAQHVDIVTDFREGGVGRAIYFDSVKLAIKNNLWYIPE